MQYPTPKDIVKDFQATKKREAEKSSAAPKKRPRVRKPHLTQRPFAEIKKELK